MFPEEYPEGFCELYDLEADPWEMSNLAFDPAYADMIGQMKEDLLNWIVSTNRPVTGGGGAPGGWQSYTRHGVSVNLDGKTDPEQIRQSKHKIYL